MSLGLRGPMQLAVLQPCRILKHFLGQYLRAVRGPRSHGHESPSGRVGGPRRQTWISGQFGGPMSFGLWGPMQLGVYSNVVYSNVDFLLSSSQFHSRLKTY